MNIPKWLAQKAACAEKFPKSGHFNLRRMLWRLMTSTFITVAKNEEGNLGRTETLKVVNNQLGT